MNNRSLNLIVEKKQIKKFQLGKSMASQMRFKVKIAPFQHNIMPFTFVTFQMKHHGYLSTFSEDGFIWI